MRINTEQARVQGVLNAPQIENLPVNGRTGDSGREELHLPIALMPRRWNTGHSCPDGEMSRSSIPGGHHGMASLRLNPAQNLVVQLRAPGTAGPGITGFFLACAPYRREHTPSPQRAQDSLVSHGMCHRLENQLARLPLLHGADKLVRLLPGRIGLSHPLCRTPSPKLQSSMARARPWGATAASFATLPPRNWLPSPQPKP